MSTRKQPRVLRVFSATLFMIAAGWIAPAWSSAEEPTTQPSRPAIPQPDESIKTAIPPRVLGTDGLPAEMPQPVAIEKPSEHKSKHPAEVVPWTLAGKHVGETITAEGRWPTPTPPARFASSISPTTGTVFT